MAAEQGEASAQVQPRSHVRTGPHVHGLELPGLRAVSKRIESTYIWQGDRATVTDVTPDGACPFAQCSKITTTCAPVNRFCRCFLWLPRNRRRLCNTL